jgi:outer membrane immunogenic protein
MSKLLLSAAAIAALFTGPALSADMPRPVTKAPPAPVAVYNWTGCYVKGGGGYGMWNQDTTEVADPSLAAIGSEIRTGGRGWFGTVGGGCDFQIGERWVIGAYGDYDFASLKGDLHVLPQNLVGSEKMKSAWAAGGRIGYLLTPAVLTYVSGGFTEARFNHVDLVAPVPVPAPVIRNVGVGSHTYSGWFVGSGFEYNLGWLPGLFWRTEYRFAQYDKDFLPVVVTATGARSGIGVESEKSVQTIRSELVWRFNWSGPVRAGY